MMPSVMRNTNTGATARTLGIGFGVLALIALAVALIGRNGSPAADAPAIVAATEATSTTATTTTGAPPSTTTTTTTLDPTTAVLDELVDTMSIDEIARQLVVTGLTGTDAATRLRDTVGGACLGGVFVTESNDNWIDENDTVAAAAFIASVPEVARSDGCASLPLLTTDAELGRIVRVPASSTATTGDYRARFDEGDQDDTLAGLAADATAYARTLRGLGLDVNFGAVADVDTAPENFMARSGRTFGAQPDTVTALAGAVVDAHCEAGLAVALKHFPNQGATREDPHEERSVARGGLVSWRETGKLPYLDTRAPMVMTGHIFLDIDPDLPASMSAAITTGLLRDELGYEGVVITDDLSTMRGAIDVIAEPGSRAVAAIRAGADLVLFVRDRDIPIVVKTLVAELMADPAFEATARERVRRVVDLKAALGRIPAVDPDTRPLCR